MASCCLLFNSSEQKQYIYCWPLPPGSVSNHERDCRDFLETFKKLSRRSVSNNGRDSDDLSKRLK